MLTELDGLSVDDIGYAELREEFSPCGHTVSAILTIKEKGGEKEMTVLTMPAIEELKGWFQSLAKAAAKAVVDAYLRSKLGDNVKTKIEMVNIPEGIKDSAQLAEILKAARAIH